MSRDRSRDPLGRELTPAIEAAPDAYEKHRFATASWPALRLCRTCFGLRGECGRPTPQRCGCERVPGEARWPGADFNTSVELCRCCGAEPLNSGSRWSVWFCTTCKERVGMLNGHFGRCVVPIGRHSFHAGYMLQAEDGDDIGELVAFLEGWRGITDAMDVLRRWALEAVRRNIEDAGLADGGGDIPLGDYLAALPRAQIVKDRRFLHMVLFLVEEGRPKEDPVSAVAPTPIAAPSPAPTPASSPTPAHTTSSAPTPAHQQAPSAGPELFVSPATRGRNGVTTRVSGPEDPPGVPAESLRRPNALIRAGMIALDHRGGRDLARAESCFREALDLLRACLGEPHAKVSYALDRIGLVCQMQGREAEAEALYLRSLEALDEDAAPTEWNDLTLLNLAILYGRQGRLSERDAVLARYGA
jgi:tetratricopeptide (TPR) repeat protein